jgi:hypothetical protein
MRPVSRILPIFTLLIAGLAAPPSEPAASKLQVTGPAVRVEPALIDLGTMPQESIERTRAWVHNIGTDSLRIQKVESDCGCTIANILREVLAPGDSVELKINFSSRHYYGNLLQRVTVFTNDPGSPRANIKLKVHVKPLAVVEPDNLDFGDVPRGSSETRTITLRAARQDSLVLERVHLPENLFTYTSRPLNEPDSTGFALDIHVRRDAPLGDIRTRVTIETNRTKDPIQVAVRGSVHGFFLARPNLVSFGQFKAGAIRTVSVMLEAQSPGHRRITAVSCSSPGLTARIATLEEGRTYEVIITATPNLAPGQLRETLLIQTDDPEQPELIVPIRGSIKE